MLPGYSKEYLDKILDLLFKVRKYNAYTNLIVSSLIFYLQPNFAASLQILKVEIGGDGQSTGLHVCGVQVMRNKQCLLSYSSLLRCYVFLTYI